MCDIKNGSNDDIFKSKFEELKKETQYKNKKMLNIEFTVIPLIFVSIILIVVSMVFDIDTVMRLILIFLAILIIIVTAGIALKIEQEVGYYQCKLCKHTYTPKYFRVLIAMHVGRIRYMKCPKCFKYSWQNKVISKD